MNLMKKRGTIVGLDTPAFNKRRGYIKDETLSTCQFEEMGVVGFGEPP